MNQPTERWDVVVVGSGPGGLTAAACLASAGKRVLVLERHDVAGGNAQVFRRHRRVGDGPDKRRDEYEFDVGVHYIGDCGPGGLFPTIFGALGLGDRMAFRPLDPDGFDTLHFPDLTLRVPADWDAYRARLIDALPEDRAGLERCLDVLRSVAEKSRARLIPGVDTATFDECAFEPLANLVDHAELSQRAQAVLDRWSGLYGSGPRHTAVAMHAGIIDHYMRGAATPLSQERYTGSTGGTSYGYVHSPEQSGRDRPQHRTEIDGLWLVGANTTSGHGILDRPLLVEMFMGTKLAEPTQIGAEPVDLDLLEYCRGERLRAQRAEGRTARAAMLG